MEVDKYDNCEKQHFANIPSIKILRSFPGTFEKRVQVEAIEAVLLVLTLHLLVSDMAGLVGVDSLAFRRVLM